MKAKESTEDLMPIFTYREYLKESENPRMPRKWKKRYKKEFKKYSTPEVMAQYKEAKDLKWGNIYDENTLYGKYDALINCLENFMN